MRKLVFFDNNQTVLLGQGHRIEIPGVSQTLEIDVTHATDPEIERLKKNPHDQQLLQKLKDRGKINKR